ncbi:MAG: SDR family oxidoreductase [candidate division NC10 bacterium]|nr:SDR family oxidoreductase [candidate division NC10 bacterium]MBI4841379.1 SDR family oxidoreductase [candidate division NC10 bacterium]
MTEFSGKTVIVTGAGRGIGRAAAMRFAAEGANILAADLEAGLLDETLGLIKRQGGKGETYRLDVTRWTEVQGMVDRALQEFGRVDVLVTSAGILGSNITVQDLSLEEWDRIHAVNLSGVFYCCKAVIPPMARQHAGAIVNMASIAGKEGNPMMAAYSSSKAGVIALTKALGKELAPQGIRVNCIAPSIIDTDMVKTVPEEQRQALKSRVPLGRFGRVEEVAALIRFLASSEASYLTAQCWDCSGGRAVY